MKLNALIVVINWINFTDLRRGILIHSDINVTGECADEKAPKIL